MIPTAEGETRQACDRKEGAIRQAGESGRIGGDESGRLCQQQATRQERYVRHT